MRKRIIPEIKYKYVGDELPEKKKEAEAALQSFYFSLFDKVSRELREKRKAHKNKVK